MFPNISNFPCKCHSVPNMYDMLQAKVDRLARTIDLVQKQPQKWPVKQKKMYDLQCSQLTHLRINIPLRLDQILA